ncbi:MAG: hypothetical protein K1X57_08560 [Gemmataceae bacterium]|nr:hypothetical protein [Gemmataceae bacterium]
MSTLLGTTEAGSVERHTSYDASGAGYRAAYLILDEVGVPVARSRYLVGGKVRWTLAPQKMKADDLAVLSRWVRDGGRLMLADGAGEIAGELGVPIERTTSDVATLNTSLDDVKTIAPGPAVVEPANPGGTTWEFAGGDALVSIHAVGQGQVWLLHRPDALSNKNMKLADNAVLAARLAEAMLEGTSGPIYFDEYCHGLRDRPGVIELLFQPPMHWATWNLLAATVIYLWARGVRFGSMRPLPPPRRRSKDEFVDALGDLLERQGDSAAAYRTAQAEVLHQLAAQVGLPATAHPDTIVSAVRRRRAVSDEAALALTSAGPPGGLVTALKTLDTVSHDILRQPSAR